MKRSTSVILLLLLVVCIEIYFTVSMVNSIPLSYDSLGIHSRERRDILHKKVESTVNNMNNQRNDDLSMNRDNLVQNKDNSILNFHKEEDEAHLDLDKYDEPQPGARELGFKESENRRISEDSGPIDVIIVPHSHCDAGWLKTFDKYYTDEVKHILTTVTEALTNNPHRKFGWVEISFLEKWWIEQPDNIKNNFKQLYENGQIEFLMGGWVSNDEATVTYMQCINQMTEGHRFLLREFGPDAIPRIGWQIDPFGLSQATATMFSQMCFGANAAWRVGGTNRRDYVDRKLLEFVWRGSPSLGPSSDVLLHLLPWSYATSDEFLFDKSNSLRVGSDNEIKLAANKLVDSFKVRTDAYPTNTLMWPWGHDFQFTKAHKMFDSMDKIIDYINSHPEYEVSVRYGTPSDYFDAIHGKELSFPMMQRDFLPYGPTPINWWNGYYTSRPRLKEYCRYLDSIQRSAEFIYTWARSSSKDLLSNSEWESLFKKLESVRHVQGIMQHHDAITGTMREHVLLDYYQMIYGATDDAVSVIETLSPMITSLPNVLPEDFTVVVPGSKITLSEVNEYPKFLILHNSLPWNRLEMISVELDSPLVSVFDVSTNEYLSSSVLPPTPKYINGGKEQSGYRLFFENNIPAVGFKIVILYKDHQRQFSDVNVYSSNNLWKDGWNVDTMPGIKTHDISKTIYLQNDDIRVDFDNNGGISKVTQKNEMNSPSMSLSKNYWQYASDSAWDNHYTFKALDSGTEIKSNSGFYYIKTPLVEQLFKKVNDLFWERTTIFKNQNYIKITDMIGKPERGRNYVARYSTSMISDGHFYTDDSGLEIVQRTYNSSDIYSGNYYPMIYSSFIREKDIPFNSNPFRQLSIVTDRTHGITSPSKGTFDLMLHRNTLQPHGNGEKMEDWNMVEIDSWLLITKEDNYNRQQFSMRLNFPIERIYFTNDNDNIIGSGSFLKEEFPSDIFLMNLEYNREDKEDIVVRVNNLRQKNIFELKEIDEYLDYHNSYSNLVENINLNELFYGVKSIEERSLSLNQKIEDCKRHHWHSHNEPMHDFMFGDSILQYAGEVIDDTISLPPLAIRSFFINFKKE